MTCHYNRDNATAIMMGNHHKMVTHHHGHVSIVSQCTECIKGCISACQTEFWGWSSSETPAVSDRLYCDDYYRLESNRRPVPAVYPDAGVWNGMALNQTENQIS